MIPTAIPKIVSTAYQTERVAVTTPSIATHMNVVLVMEIVTQEHVHLEQLAEKTIFLTTIRIWHIAREHREPKYVFHQVGK